MKRVEKKSRPAVKRAAGKTDSKKAGAIRAENLLAGGRSSGMVRQGSPISMDKEAWILAAKERLSDLPEVRPEKIREAEKRIEGGFYDRPEVVSKIVDRFLEEMGIL